MATAMEQWIFELDFLGALADRADIEAHLAKCPLPKSEEAQVARDLLAMRMHDQTWTAMYGRDMSADQDKADQ